MKPAYMTLPPSIGVPSIAPSCFSCFDLYTNGPRRRGGTRVIWGLPFDAKKDEMTTAPLMVTVRNAKGRRMLDTAVKSGRVEILQRGGVGGRELPSTGDRRSITVKTVQGDSMVKTLLEPDFVAGDQGAPPFVANILADVIARTLPTGLEFARYSIDYHYIRNQLFCDDRMGTRAARHVPSYARAICEPYADDVEALKNPPPPALAALVFRFRWTVAAASSGACSVIEERRLCAIDAFTKKPKNPRPRSSQAPSSIHARAPRQAHIRNLKWHLVDDHFSIPRNRGQTRALNSSPCLQSWESISKSGEHLRRTRLWEPSSGLGTPSSNATPH